jgi:hypothetical protein
MRYPDRPDSVPGQAYTRGHIAAGSESSRMMRLST